MNWINNLLNEDGTLSSKRFISIYALMLLTVVVVAILNGVIIPAELIYSLSGIITGSAALTMINKPKYIDRQTNIDEP